MDDPSASASAGATRAGRRSERAGPPRTRARGRLALRRVDALDGLRVIGAVCVVVYHVMGAVLEANPPATVIMPPIAFTFFVISGFVIYRPFAAAHLTRQPMPSPRRFWTSRAIRVLPLWWLAVTTYLVVDGTEALRTPVDWIATYALLQFAVPEVRYAVIGPAWALSVEWIFYLLVPVLALAIRGGHRRFAPRQDALRVQYAVLLPMLALAAILPPTRPFMAILVGMVLGVAAVEQQLTRRTPEAIELLRSPAVATGVTIAAWVGLLFYPYQEGLSVQWVEQDPVIVAIWIVVATVWFGPVAFGRADGPINRRLGSPFAVRVSLLTFGLYVWHDLVLRQVTSRLGTDVHLLGAMYLTLLGAFAISILTFVTVEKPMMRLRTHLVPPSSVVAAMAAGAATSPADGTRADAAATAPPRRERWTALGGLGVLAALGVAAAHVARVADLAPDAYQALIAVVLPLLGTCALATGFLLHRPWAVQQVRADGTDGPPPDGGLARTWARRALGLYPAYWIALAAAVALLGADGIEGPAAWARTLAGVPLAPLDGLMGDGAELVAWPLAVGICSVVLVPVASRLATGLVARGASPAAATAAVTAPPFLACVALGATAAWGWALGACTALGVALATADAWQRANRRRLPALRPAHRRPGLVVAIAALAAAAAWAVTSSSAGAAGAPLTGALPARTAGLVVGAGSLGAVAVLAPPRARARRILGSPALVALAPLAFGTLLWNDPLLREAAARADVPAALLAVGAIPAAAAASALVLRLLQRPLAGAVPPPTRERTPA